MTIDVAIGASLAALAAFEVWLTHDNAPASRRATEPAPPILPTRK